MHRYRHGHRQWHRLLLLRRRQGLAGCLVSCFGHRLVHQTIEACLLLCRCHTGTAAGAAAASRHQHLLDVVVDAGLVPGSAQASSSDTSALCCCLALQHKAVDALLVAVRSAACAVSAHKDEQVPPSGRSDGQLLLLLLLLLDLQLCHARVHEAVQAGLLVSCGAARVCDARWLQVGFNVCVDAGLLGLRGAGGAGCASHARRCLQGLLCVDPGVDAGLVGCRAG